jgi:Leucine-rich repeat (LRR) protein
MDSAMEGMGSMDSDEYVFLCCHDSYQFFFYTCMHLYSLFEKRSKEIPHIKIERKEGCRIDCQPTMEIALQRIQERVNGILNLSGLNLTELPPLPEGITVLRCDSNQLTSLPTLPSTLEVLHCHQNHLTSLPELPSLTSLSCSHNPLFFLPSLPSSLKQLVCMRNHLTSLPRLPDTLLELCIDYNYITHLPELPSHLTELSCSFNQLTSLPPLPSLQSLFLFGNLLESLPELPSTLIYMVCILPHNNERFAPERVTPDMIQQVNRENQEWMELQSMKRCMGRCSTYYEELMCVRWHPDRVLHLYAMGYMPEDM